MNAITLPGEAYFALGMGLFGLGGVLVARTFLQWQKTRATPSGNPPPVPSTLILWAFLGIVLILAGGTLNGIYVLSPEAEFQNWKRYQSPDGVLHWQFPSEPEIKHTNIKGPKLRRFRSWTVLRRQKQVLLSIAVYEQTAEFLKRDKHSQQTHLKQQMQERFQRLPDQFSLTAETPTKLGKVTGMQYKFQAKSGKITMIIESFLHLEKEYRCVVSAPTELIARQNKATNNTQIIESKEIERFLISRAFKK